MRYENFVEIGGWGEPIEFTTYDMTVAFDLCNKCYCKFLQQQYKNLIQKLINIFFCGGGKHTQMINQFQ